MENYILQRQQRSPRAPLAILDAPTLEQVQQWLPESKRGQLWSVDIETTGVEAHAGSAIVGMGLADQDGCFYINWPSSPICPKACAIRSYVMRYLGDCRLTAFNAMFEAGFFYRYMGRHFNWIGCSYALFKNLTSERWPGQKWGLEAAQANVLGWTSSNKTVLEAALKEHGLTKATMAQLPVSILGPYCAADADSDWQLWECLTAQATPEELDYHQRAFMTEVRLLVEQQMRGTVADQERLAECRAGLVAATTAAIPAFLQHPDVAPHVEAYNFAVQRDYVGREPDPVTKAGKVSARWEAWQARAESWMKTKGFNPNSKQQLAWLFYEALKLPVVLKTPAGKPSVSKKALPGLGEPGKILAGYNKDMKRLSYTEAVIAKSAADGLIHPQFNSVGTVTTRLGGSGGLNMQQQPKIPELLWSLRARDGYKLVQADATALEPVILAQFSKDPALLRLYGPGAPPNDVYLFVASKIPALGKNIVQHYDPLNPTKEGIAAAKKHCKRDRDAAKEVHLASVYGAGPEKLHETLMLKGIEITLKEIKQIHKDYWKLFAGIKSWESRLKDIWHQTGGWVPSLLGRRLPVAQTLLKDIVNRHTQTSGHEFLQVWLWHVARLRAEFYVTMHPWLVDNHDEMIFEVPEEQADAAAQILHDALQAANHDLQMEIPIQGPPLIVDNLAQIKCENYDKWLTERSAA